MYKFLEEGVGKLPTNRGVVRFLKSNLICEVDSGKGFFFQLHTFLQNIAIE